MKKKDFESFIKTLGPKLYSFSYALIPDDLQAQQLVIDTLTVVALQEKTLLSPILNNNLRKSSAFENEYLNFEKCLYKHINRLGVKRYFQLKESFIYEKSVNGQFIPFYQLDIHERAILFLKDKTDFSLQDLTSILNFNENDVIAKLNSARSKLARLIGYEEEVALEIV